VEHHITDFVEVHVPVHPIQDASAQHEGEDDFKRFLNYMFQNFVCQKLFRTFVVSKDTYFN
jgi:hypothetical protein